MKARFHNILVRLICLSAIVLTLPSGVGFAISAPHPDVAVPFGEEIASGKAGKVDSTTDFVPRFLTNADLFQMGADRLTLLQNNDGGWDWPLDDGNPASVSPLNTLGPISKGLAEAYRHTGDLDHRAALVDAGALLLTKTNNFSPSDGYLAATLDEILGGTTYRDHVMTYFYGPLAAGTYNRNGAGTLYDTAGYVNLIRTARQSQGIANLAAWDIGMGLVGAASVGADTTAWIAGVKAEIDELDGAQYYDVLGLAGAIYGLAYVGEDFDPTAGEHAAANNLADLGAILATYQISSGGFTWNSGYVSPTNETNQETAYAILALNELDRTTYLSAITAAADYLESVQLPTGGWNSYPGEVNGENNELTGEALWGIHVAYPLMDVWVCPSGDCGHPGASFNTIQEGVNVVQTGGTVHVAAGTYVENVSIPKSSTLQGAQFDVSVSGRTAAGPGESTIQGLVSVNASNVDINGFTLTNPGQTYAVSIPPTSSNVSITYNIVDNVGSVALGSNVHAIIFQNGADAVTIAHNRFSNINANTKSVSSIGVLDSVSTNPSTDVLIQDNIFTNIASVTKGAYGVIINNAAGAPGAQIKDNTFSGLSGGWTHAIGLEGPTNGAIVTGNVFSNLTAAGSDNVAIFFEKNPVGDTVTVSQNQFNGSAFYGVAIHPNDLPGGANGYNYMVTAENNWWNAVSGPGAVGTGTGALVGLNVDYSPWCTDAACASSAPPFATTTTITADTPDPSQIGQTVSVTATVAGLPAGAPTPTGTVTISGGVTDCIITLAGGTGACDITFNTPGVTTITAAYSPDSADFSASNDTESHTVTFIKNTFQSTAAYDGWILESGPNSNAGGTLDATSITFNIGDDAANQQYRAILSFNTDRLPDTAVITNVTLKIRMQGIVGTNPFTILGGLMVDMRVPFLGPTVGLTAQDFQAVPGRIAVATFGATPVNNWYSAVLNAIGRNYLNKTGTTQFRLYFATDDNNNYAADYMKFFSGNCATTSARPTLIVEYYIP